MRARLSDGTRRLVFTPWSGTWDWLPSGDAGAEARAILAETEQELTYWAQYTHPHSLSGWPEGLALAEALEGFVLGEPVGGGA